VGYRYYICDVFTDRRFGGNPLAVLPSASGLGDAQMLQIAREFNFSETTFVLPAEQGHTRKVRIFCPTAELPFAGHPNIGTAFVLAATGELGELGPSTRIVFEELAGPVPIRIEAAAGAPTRCELTAPEPLSLGASYPADAVARALSLTPAEVSVATHPPQIASVGLPFLFVELTGRPALARARIDPAGFDALEAGGPELAIHAYVRSADDFDVRARVFVPVGEDPATGSANCALAGMLTLLDPLSDGELRWRIAQGVEMGRPSTLHACAEKRDGRIVSTRIAGASVMVSEGTIEVD